MKTNRQKHIPLNTSFSLNTSAYDNDDDTEVSLTTLDQTSNLEDIEFTLKNGDTLKIDDILSKVEWLTSNNRYMIVEDVVSRKVGIYDAKNDILKVKCVFDKIEYLNDKNGFRCYLDKQIKELDYKKLSSNKFSGKKSEIIIVNNLSLYYSEPFMIDMLNGKRTTLKR